MGLGYAMGVGLESAAKVGSDSAQHWLTAEIERTRAEALAELQSGLRMKEAEHAADVDVKKQQRVFDQNYANSPRAAEMEANKTRATKQAEIDVATDPKNVEAAAAKIRAMAPAEAYAQAEKSVAEIIAKGRPEALAAAKSYAAAVRDPLQQKLLNTQIAEAELKLDEAKEQSSERKEVRGLIDASKDVDAGQPGGAEARKFYEDEARRTGKGSQLDKGVYPDEADRAAYLALAKEKYEMANKEIDPERKARLEREGDEYAKAATDKGTPGAAGRQTQEQAAADAERAIATGKITREKANERLVANGYAPLPGGKSDKKADEPAAAAPAKAEPVNIEARIAEIEAKLKASDNTKFDMDTPLYKTMGSKLAPAERRRLELELEQLKAKP